MVGRAEKHRLVGAERIEIEDRTGARHHEQRRRAATTPAQVGDQRFLRGPVEALFDEVDDDGRRRFQTAEQGPEGRRIGGAILYEQADRRLDLRLKRRIGRAVEAEEDTVEFVGNPHRQPGLAAAQRAGDVGEGTDVAQFERLAAPRPGKLERDVEPRRRDECSGEVGHGRRAAAGEVAPHRTHALQGRDHLTEARFEGCLVAGERRLEAARIAF